MGKVLKGFIITASVLVVIGAIIFAVVMVSVDWDFSKLGTNDLIENTYDITDDFKSISMNTETADITFELTDDKNCRVECYEYDDAPHSVEVKDNTLTIEVDEDRAWYFNIGINIGSPKLTIFLPKEEYSSLFIDEHTGNVTIPADFEFDEMDITTSTGGVMINSSADDVKIKTSTGAICVEDIKAKSIDVSASTGNITLDNVKCDGEIKADVTTGKNVFTDVECANLTSKGSTGKLTLTNVVAKDAFILDRSTGSIEFDGCDANEIFAETSTGSVSGSLLSDKVFIAESDTGNIDVPKSVTGGRCEITTDTGSIKIDIAG